MKVFVMLLLVVAAATAQDFECPTAGIFAADDCSGFYVCGYNVFSGRVDELSFVECPDGKLFNAEARKCQPPSVFTCPT